MASPRDLQSSASSTTSWGGATGCLSGIPQLTGLSGEALLSTPHSCRTGASGSGLAIRVGVVQVESLIARTLGHIPLVCGSSRYRFEDLPPGGAVTGVDDLAHTMVVLVDDPQAIGKRVGILSGP